MTSKLAASINVIRSELAAFRAELAAFRAAFRAEFVRFWKGLSH